MPRVYIPNKQHYDYSGAEEFGELVFMTIGNLTLEEVDNFETVCYKYIREMKRDDYLMIVSLNSICCITAAFLVKCTGHLNLLINRKGVYIPIHINLPCELV